MLPFLVVIIITPFDAREPYIADADASFKTVIDSTVAGFNEAKNEEEPTFVVLSSGNPSITIRGSLLAKSELPPRILI